MHFVPSKFVVLEGFLNTIKAAFYFKSGKKGVSNVHILNYQTDVGPILNTMKKINKARRQHVLLPSVAAATYSVLWCRLNKSTWEQHIP